MPWCEEPGAKRSAFAVVGGQKQTGKLTVVVIHVSSWVRLHWCGKLVVKFPESQLVPVSRTLLLLRLMLVLMASTVRQLVQQIAMRNINLAKQKGAGGRGDLQGKARVAETEEGRQASFSFVCVCLN